MLIFPKFHTPCPWLGFLARTSLLYLDCKIHPFWGCWLKTLTVLTNQFRAPYNFGKSKLKRSHPSIVPDTNWNSSIRRASKTEPFAILNSFHQVNCNSCCSLHCQLPKHQFQIKPSALRKGSSRFRSVFIFTRNQKRSSFGSVFPPPLLLNSTTSVEWNPFNRFVVLFRRLHRFADGNFSDFPFIYLTRKWGRNITENFPLLGFCSTSIARKNNVRLFLVSFRRSTGNHSQTVEPRRPGWRSGNVFLRGQRWSTAKHSVEEKWKENNG